MLVVVCEAPVAFLGALRCRPISCELKTHALVFLAREDVIHIASIASDMAIWNTISGKYRQCLCKTGEERLI